MTFTRSSGLRAGPFLALSLIFALAACSGGGAEPAAEAADGAPVYKATVPAGCDESAFCVGAAKADISPGAAHIAGVPEPRLGGQTVNQQFHLGGFGFGPFDSFGPLNDSISEEAAKRASHVNRAAQDERTFLRVMYLTKPGSNLETVFAVIDAIGAGNIIQSGIQQAIAQATGVPAEHVITAQTHSHAGADLQGLWGGVPQNWVKNTLYAGAARAAKDAQDHARKVRLLYAHGLTSEFNNFRRPQRVRGEDADANLSLLVARDLASGRTVGSLMQYAAHPTNIGTGSGGGAGRAVHGDYILGATDKLEQALGGTAVYFNGPIADASPSGAGGADSYETARVRGTGIAGKALEAFAASALELRPELAIAQRTVTLPITNPLFLGVGVLGAFNRYYDFMMLPFSSIPGIGPIAADQQSNLPQLTPTATTLVSRITLGGTGGANRLELVTIPGETTNSFGRYIRSLATTPNVMLFGLTHNSFGYILPEDEFNYINEDGDDGFTAPFTGYEEFVSLGPLTATLLRMNAYNPLFNLPPEQNVPPTVANCLGNDPFGSDCFLAAVARRPDYFQKGMADLCRSNGLPEAFCALVDPQTPLAQPCRDAGLPEATCQTFGEGEERPAPVTISSFTDCLDNNAHTPCMLPVDALPPSTPGPLKVGVGVVDMTPNVGFCAGQYCDALYEPLADGDLEGTAEAVLENLTDPFVQARTKQSSYGIQSRLTARALVIQGGNGRRMVLLKSDNYLAQDHLIRRVGQILAEGNTGITPDQILYHVTHNHSSAYYSTPSWGVWLFEDVFDQRLFEYQARKLALAIEVASANMKPARMGATTIQHDIYKGNVVRLATADDGTPAGYPLEFGDHGLTVLRFDDLSNPAQPKPLAIWMNWGEHPESLDGYGLHTADFLGPLERFVERQTGAPLIFSQGDVGSAESSGNSRQMLDDNGAVCGDWPNGAAPLVDNCPERQGVVRDWNHQGYVQTERNVRYLADDVIRAWNLIGAGKALVPFTTDPAVDYRLAWTPGPLSHPYPSISNCRTEPTANGNPGAPILGLPDCARAGPTPLSPAFAPVALAVETLRAEGVPIPDHYDANAFTAVEENLRLKLQAFRLGDILLASCACEAQVDLILNLETRADDVANNIYDGFDWACLLPQHSGEQVCLDQRQYYDPSRFPAAIPGTNFAPAAIARMRAQIHNDARGWDAPGNAAFANTEPNDPARIWGNFTKEELPPQRGYRMVVGIGHGGDYNGYTVSYREYQNRDSYRKALTAYGPHTADYMVTRLVRMAGAMKGGPELAPEPQDATAQADEARQIAASTALGQLTSNGYTAWEAVLPDDIGPAAVLAQPEATQRFDAATFEWRGGSNAIDIPEVRVERELAPGQWTRYADMTGEVQVKLTYPGAGIGAVQTWAGMQQWKWTANFEAYTAFPARLGSTPAGTYRFVVDGQMRRNHATVPYHLESAPFGVTPWRGIEVTNARKLADGSVAFDTPAEATYPKSYAGDLRFINGSSGDARICDQCAFRPWARGARLASANVQVFRADGSFANVAAVRAGNSWSAPAALKAGDRANLRVTDVNGNTSEPLSLE